jgi:hypothetical protein
MGFMHASSSRSPLHVSQDYYDSGSILIHNARTFDRLDVTHYKPGPLTRYYV